MKTLFYFENKWIAQSTKLFTDVLYIFLGHDGCFWKINLRIFWNHMKNFQVKHSQCDGIIFPKTFSFKSFRQLLDLCYAGSRILYYWKVLESFHTFLGVISQCAPFLYPLKKFSSPLQLAKKKIYLDTQLKGELTILFWKLPGCSLFPQAE